MKRIAPAVVWLTGLSGAGKTTLANALRTRIVHLGSPAVVLDGDALRSDLSRDLGFDAAARAENARRAAAVANLMVDAGLVVIVALISPSRVARAGARAAAAPRRFVEVFVDTPLATVRAADPKGLYRAADRGEICDMAGIDLPYEMPLSPELHLRMADIDPDAAVLRIIEELAG